MPGPVFAKISSRENKVIYSIQSIIYKAAMFLWEINIIRIQQINKTHTIYKYILM